MWYCRIRFWLFDKTRIASREKRDNWRNKRDYWRNKITSSVNWTSWSDDLNHQGKVDPRRKWRGSCLIGLWTPQHWKIGRHRRSGYQGSLSSVRKNRKECESRKAGDARKLGGLRRNSWGSFKWVLHNS